MSELITAAALLVFALAFPAVLRCLVAREAPTKCRFLTDDDGGWGYGNHWYCTTHQRWYPEQVFMVPPKSCKPADAQGSE